MKQGITDGIALAAEYWSNGQPLEAGKLIYEALPTKSRPKWASRILKLVLEKSCVESTLFTPVLAAADQEESWKTGHEVFSELRDSVLKLDEQRKQSGLSESEKMLSAILSLAELVAKVIYNATEPQNEFDEDSGWWIAASLRGFLDHDWNEESFATSAWAALSSSE
jgi:hypothetical protein